MSNDSDTGGSDWVEKRLTQEEAETFAELWSKISEEQKAQLRKQGMSNSPAPYKSLIRTPLRYVRERYLDTEKQQ